MKNVRLSLLLCLFLAPALMAQDRWHLDRIDQRTVPLDCAQNTGPGVDGGVGTTIFVLDAGVDITVPEFEGRFTWAYTAASIVGGPEDNNGFGTWVASIAGGADHGVAVNATVSAVKVLNDLRVGTTADIVDGLSYIQADHLSHPQNKTVALFGFPLGPSPDPAIITAINGLIVADVTVVVPAGDGNVDDCVSLSTLHPDVIVVGATDKCDNRSAFSNFGSCLDLFAPGSEVEGSFPVWASPPYAPTVLSNSSASAAMVAGAAAVYMSSLVPPQPPFAVKTYLDGMATLGVLGINIGSGSPDKLLFVDEILLHHGTPCTWTLPTCTPCTSGSAEVNAVYGMDGPGALTPWTWKIEFPSVPALNSGVQSVPGVSGSTTDIANTFAKEINDYFAAQGLDAPDTSLLSNYSKACGPPPPPHDFQAIVTDCFSSVFLEVRAPCEFKLFVSPVATPSNPTCEVTSATACYFNPGIWEIPMSSQDCNENGQDDSLDIGTGISLDANSDSIPDECQGGGVNAWSDQGSALAGVDGDPQMVGMGTLAAGSHNVIDLSHAAPSAPAYLFYGVASAPVSLWGGMVVPGPSLAWLGPFQTSPTGELVLTHDVPATGYPSGEKIWLQWALLDAAAIHGKAISNAIRGDIP